MNMHISQFKDSAYLSTEMLQGREVVVEIEKVDAPAMRTFDGGRKAKAGLLYFVGKEKPMVLRAAHTRKEIVEATGSEWTKDWIGKRITLYPSTVTFGGVEKPCIKIKAA